MFIKLGSSFFNPDHIVAIKPQGDDACSIFTCGQSAIDGGFLVDIPEEEVRDIIRTVRYTSLIEEIDKVGRDGDDTSETKEEVQARMDHR